MLTVSDMGRTSTLPCRGSKTGDLKNRKRSSWTTQFMLPANLYEPSVQRHERSHAENRDAQRRSDSSY
ncbi:hypothetical protein ANANG_G00072570 [Anguilla anguilla]|uniref:Uncharacterized protein n=1 Tax=Anguilla anguilla TaxID=7936 RepID=A0A9D3MQP4_ANGAN|nr:hypothetical protein ANANG_G00072570 [Anguilla anguilla]